MKQAQITSENTAAKDLGVIFSSGIGDLTTIQEQVIKMHEKGPKRVSPMFVLTAIVNMAADNIALRIGAKNICTSAVTACASGTNAIGEAYRQIKEGRAKVRSLVGQKLQSMLMGRQLKQMMQLKPKRSI